MKKFLFFLLLVILYSCPAIAGISDYVEGEVIVILDAQNASAYSGMGAFSMSAYSQAVSNQAEAFASEFGLETFNTLSEIASLSGKNIIRLRSEYKSTDELIQELSSVEGVLSVSPNYIIKIDPLIAQTATKQYQVYNIGRVPNDPDYSQLWGMDNIGMPRVWEHFTGSNNVVVAVLDSGIDYNHPDLFANMARDSYGNYGRSFVNGTQSGNPMDSRTHGTHVAGTIGAVGNNGIGATGVNWRVGLLAVNVMSGNGYYDVIDGIDYVLSEKRKGLNIRVVNMSFGYISRPDSDNTAMETAIRLLSNAGIICVMSAGNDGLNLNTSLFKSYPACFKFDNTITVGAIGRNNQRSIWAVGAGSNYGNRWVDIAAPGDDIYSTTPNNSYYSHNGTSMAAPHVTGAAALLCAAYPNETAKEIKARILNRAKKIGVAEEHWRNGTLDVFTAYGIPEIITSALPNGAAGVAYNQTLGAIGNMPITWSLNIGSLPPGLSLNATTGAITGTPTSAGTYSFTVRAANRIGTAAGVLTIAITATQVPPIISTASLPNGLIESSYNQALRASGTAPITWSIANGTLPAGLILNTSNGMISGIPTTSGTFNFTIRATNTVGTTTRALSIVIITAPIIRTTNLPDAAFGKPYSQTLIVSGTAPITWEWFPHSAGNLPDGLSLNRSTGVISGTPTVGGKFSITITASNAGGNDIKNLDIFIITSAPIINTSSLPGGIVGIAYNQTLSVTGTTPITWSITSGRLPTGLSMNVSTGAITGTPTAMGTFNFTVRATNSAGNSSKSLSITITAVPGINTSSLPGGIVGRAYNQTLRVTGTTPMTWSITSGRLPTGLSMNVSTGAITGTPSAMGTFNFTVRATNSAGFGTKDLRIDITSAPTINTSSLPGGIVGRSYNQTLSATGTTPMTWSITSGRLPTGLNMNASTGVITGTPTAMGTFNFTARATNSAGNSSKSLSIVITAAPTINTSSLPIGNVSRAYSQTLSVTGTTPITWSIASGMLPNGLSLNGSTGVISGTPTVKGTFNFTIRAANPLGNATKTLSIVIN